MAYKTILVHIDGHPHQGFRLQVATGTARTFGAYLVGLASSGGELYLENSSVQNRTSPAVTYCLENLREHAGRALADFLAASGQNGVHDVETRKTDADASDALAGAAVYADLCVIGHYGRQPRLDGQGREMVADVAIASGYPVLAIPDGALEALAFRKVLVGGNGSREAPRAVHAAMPVLQGAIEVEVAVVGPALKANQGLFPAVEVGKMLARHGVANRVLQRPDTSEIGHALLELAGDHAVDLIVMGCYGHSRVREVLMGGRNSERAHGCHSTSPHVCMRRVREDSAPRLHPQRAAAE